MAGMGYLMKRVYPEGKSLYVRVIVWDTKREMYHGVPDSHPWTYGAICRAYTQIRYQKGRPRRMLGVVADVHFWKGALGSGTTSHEFMHAAIAWAIRVKLDFGPIVAGGSEAASPEEERLCYAHGRMVGEFVDWLYASRLV
jgi:hypothetical protein